jgi:hypothetical protein
VKAPGVRNRIRTRRARRQAERAARRTGAPQVALPRMSTPAEFVEAVTRLRAREHVMIDEHGNVTTVEVDPDRFAAAMARLDSHPHDDVVELDEIDDADEIDSADDDGSLAGADDDCPICRALRESAVGPPRRSWLLDG